MDFTNTNTSDKSYTGLRWIYSNLGVCESETGGQLASVRLCDVLLYLEPAQIKDNKVQTFLDLERAKTVFTGEHFLWWT